MRPALTFPVLFAALAACGDDVATSIDVGPTGPPTIAFVDPDPAAAPQCREIGSDAQAAIPLRVEVDELVLRPPGGCGVFAQCGYLRLYAGGVANNEAASAAFDLLLGKLADPIHDGSPHAATGEPDLLALTVEVLDDEGAPLADHDGAPLTAAVSIATLADCDEYAGAE